MVQKLIQSPRQLWLVNALAALVFGLVVGVVTLTLRADLRRQLPQRDLDVLSAVTAMLAENASVEYAGLGLESEPELVAAEVAVLSASVEGVLAVSVHETDGRFIWGAPEALLPAPFTGEPDQVSYEGDYPLSAIFNINEPGETLPLVEARAPVSVGGSEWVVRYWIDGEPTRQAFAAMDRRLARQAIGAWLAGCLLLLGLSWLQQRAIELRQDLLARRTRELEDANRDLDFSTKSSALGAVAAGLVHDLRNPLSVLRQTIASPEASDVEAAKSAAQKMESIILEVVSIMRDQDNVRAAPYEWDDIRHALTDAFAHDERLRFAGEATRPLSGQQGGLLILILKQLAANALRASRNDGPVTVSVDELPECLCVRVADEAGGVAPPAREALFRPVQEAARTGSGLGLALARQFAKSLGGDLALESSNDRGSTFAVTIPLKKLTPNEATDSPTDHPITAPANR